MTPFESLISELGTQMELPLKPDHHQSCRLDFGNDLKIQLDLTGEGDQILIGSELGSLVAGIYRQKILDQALRVNSLSRSPHGTLAFSEKNDSLVLFQFFPLASLSGEKLWAFLQLFIEHATIWKEAMAQGEVPLLEEDMEPKGSGFYGLK